MALRNFITVLDIERQVSEPINTFIVRQYDKGFTVQINLLNNGEPLDMEGKQAYLVATTNQGLLEKEMNVSGNIATVELGEDATGSSGAISPYVQVRVDDTIVAATNSFSIQITPAADLTLDEAVAKQSRLDKAIDAWEAFNTGANESENVRQQQENTRQQTENERRDSEQARQSNEQLRLSQESVREQKENARVEAENARVDAENSRVEVESSRVSSEETRVSAEQARIINESGRIQAEQVRAQAEQVRAQQQIRNNTDQAANNAAAQGITYQVLSSGEYSLDSEGKHNVPSVDGQNGKIYFTPNPKAEANNKYEQWMWVNSQWELSGEGMYVEPIVTADIDKLVTGGQLTGERYLNVSGLTYLLRQVVDAVFPIGSYRIIDTPQGISSAAGTRMNLGLLGVVEKQDNFDLPLWKRVS